METGCVWLCDPASDRFYNAAVQSLPPYPPSASFALDWGSIRAMRARGVAFATITLAAGISSTGDPELDRRLPFDEPYHIPDPTASAIRQGRAAGGRIIAIGTTVVRALEHAAREGGVRAGEGIADQRLGPTSRLQIVDAILSGTHEPGSSHYQLLRAFLDDTTLADASAALEAAGYLTHEFGDSVLIEKQDRILAVRGESLASHRDRRGARGLRRAFSSAVGWSGADVLIETSHRETEAQRRSTRSARTAGRAVRRKSQTNDRATLQSSFACGLHASPAATRRRVGRTT